MRATLATLNCSITELVVQHFAVLAVATIHGRYPTLQLNPSRFLSSDRARTWDHKRDTPPAWRPGALTAVHKWWWWPGAAYPESPQCNILESFGVPLLHVHPNYLWSVLGQIVGWHKVSAMLKHVLSYFKRNRGNVPEPRRDMYIVGAVNMHIDSTCVKRLVDRLAQTAGVPTVQSTTEPFVCPVQLWKG